MLNNQILSWANMNQISTEYFSRLLFGIGQFFGCTKFNFLFAAYSPDANLSFFGSENMMPFCKNLDSAIIS